MLQHKLWQLLTLCIPGEELVQNAALRGFAFKATLPPENSSKSFWDWDETASLAAPNSAGQGGSRAGELLIHLGGREWEGAPGVIPECGMSPFKDGSSTHPHLEFAQNWIYHLRTLIFNQNSPALSSTLTGWKSSSLLLHPVFKSLFLYVERGTLSWFGRKFGDPLPEEMLQS